LSLLKDALWCPKESDLFLSLCKALIMFVCALFR